MASSDTTLQSTLESLCKYSANHVDDDYLKLSRDIAFLMDSTTKKESLRTINTFHDGQSISSLLDVLKSNPSGKLTSAPSILKIPPHALTDFVFIRRSSSGHPIQNAHDSRPRPLRIPELYFPISLSRPRWNRDHL